MGLYAAAIPGAFLGLGCGTLSRVKSIPLAIFSFVCSIPLGILAEWSFMPFVADESLTFFLENMTTRTKLFVGIGAVLAAWFGLGRPRMMLEKG